MRLVVLHARVNFGAGGGIDKTVLNSPRFLASAGYESHCVYLRDPKNQAFHEIEKRGEALCSNVIAIDDRGPLDISVIKNVLRVCKRTKTSIWHGHDYKTNVLGLILRKFHKMHLITTTHGWGDIGTKRLPLYYAIDRRCLRYYDHVIAVSSDLADICRSAGVPGEKTVAN